MRSAEFVGGVVSLVLVSVFSCGGDDGGVASETGTSSGTETGTSSGAETGTSSGTEAGTSSGTEAGTSSGTETDTSGGAECVDDSACVDLGLVCNETSGACVAAGCEGEDDFTPCEVVTRPDRSFDICVGGACVSPGCGEVSCNVPAPHFPLADTNQRECYDATESSSCPSPGQPFFGQDAHFGWDTTHAASERFSRDVGLFGEPVVTDNVTALVWQGCTVGLSGDDCGAGFVAKASWSEQLAACDALSWGGYDDWRLPDPYEMQSIIDQNTADSPYVDATVFPATATDWHWSSSSSVDTTWAWTVNYGFGTVALDYKENARSARCVRGGALQARHFEPSTIEGDRVVTDTQGGLMWQGCPQGTSGDECGAGIITWSTWEAALAYCEGLSLGGLSDWRLPDINELQSIVDYRYESLSIDPDVFPGPSNSGWTSTTRTSYTGHALIVNFEVGNTSSIAKADLAGSVRCVHDP